MEVSGTLTRFLAPNVKLSDGKSIALRDCVYLAELGTVVGVVVGEVFPCKNSLLEELFTNLEHQERYAHNDTYTYI